ncbi:hypothetical protein [Lentibacillus sp. JNUCC-1]|uniref:hypothetical protein n=1 Tax=Lentibacillus sp. JNUCC-1 TaxID=2654513 RepID=UPI0012E80206|nr:hypothetical protein [Lentibacillus sp. JNUCC-1]
MIDEKNVIRMRVPFPDIDSGLAARPHMYICLKSGTQKEFIKCQTFKPRHLFRNKAPHNYLIEDPDIDRNPFYDKTTIDCDKSFGVENVTVDKSLITDKREDVCDALFRGVKHKINHSNFVTNFLDIAPLLTINSKITSNQ